MIVKTIIMGNIGNQRYINMRCLSCNCNLNDRESTRKSLNTGEYLDLCDSCLSETDIIVSDSSYEEWEEEDDEYFSET